MTASAPGARTLSLTIPCYNEAASLPALVERCGQALGNEHVEIVLVDNGSVDDTPKIIDELIAGRPRLRTVRVEVNQGYGFGILAGLCTASTDLVGWTHADLQTDPTDVLPAWALYQHAADWDRLFVKGRRRQRPFADLFFTAGMGVLESAIFGRRLTDINAQPTVMPRRFFETWSDPPSDFSLDLFAFVAARGAGLRVERVPVLFGRRAHGESHWNTSVRARMRFISRTLRYSADLRRGRRA